MDDCVKWLVGGEEDGISLQVGDGEGATDRKKKKKRRKGGGIHPMTSSGGLSTPMESLGQSQT